MIAVTYRVSPIYWTPFKSPLLVVTEVINKKWFHAHEIKTREFLFSAMSFASLVVIMLYDKEHKTKTIEFLFASQSVTVSQSYFKRYFKSTKAPSRNTVLRLFDKFRKEGTVDNLRGTARLRKPVRTPQIVKKVVNLIEKDPEQCQTIRAGSWLQPRHHPPHSQTKHRFVPI